MGHERHLNGDGSSDLEKEDLKDKYGSPPGDRGGRAEGKHRENRKRRLSCNMKLSKKMSLPKADVQSYQVLTFSKYFNETHFKMYAIHVP